MRIRSAGEIMNYFDFYSMPADSLHAWVPISLLNSFSTKMLVRQVGHVTINMLENKCGKFGVGKKIQSLKILLERRLQEIDVCDKILS